MSKGKKSVTLVELLIAISLIFLVVMGISSMEVFSRQHLIGSSRRSLLQNELSSALEHISKNIARATGNQSAAGNQPIQLLANGFSVRVDTKQTMQDLSDDLVFSYTSTLDPTTGSYTLSCKCVGSDCPADIVLSSHLRPNVTNGVMTDSIAPDALSGLYIDLPAEDKGTTAEIGLVARYYPDKAISSNNPQIQMKSRMHTSNASAA
ncbi:MAG: hypothetical protein NT088_06330 [Candidatus Omnitrophica bacterium]|nr:hypothetical protein [Candidatus Omnitrophota bacterium]